MADAKDIRPLVCDNGTGMVKWRSQESPPHKAPNVLAKSQFVFPRVFDLVHCACCRVPWHIEGGKLLLELNRVLQPGGYFVWSATPVYQKLAEDVEIWTAMSAIKADPLCYEALERLIENHMLKSEEESSLISSLKFAPEDKWLSSFYSCLIKKYDKESMVEAKFRKLEQETCDNNTASLPVACTLKNNTDLLACKAEYYHQSGEYQKCFELTSALLERDPFHLKSTLVHLTAAMELGHSNELYLMACHGNAFAAQEEGDQAISSFRTAARSFPGLNLDILFVRCHLPTLYIGMEYMRTHNLKLEKEMQFRHGDSKGSVKGGHGRKEVAGVQSGQSSQTRQRYKCRSSLGSIKSVSKGFGLKTSSFRVSAMAVYEVKLIGPDGDENEFELRMTVIS
ncbi:hypothetical protein IFM89_012290 [Coptis chinensis]|uniref:Methyltransferase n=1 Tax=Coptis chinensis TaxID=261450 RepID=A0A835LM56_9MAGN|nr:hypothetical protein IFM89_012290 [Coptis chinensis]